MIVNKQMVTPAEASDEEVAQTIIAMERAALDRSVRGDATGFLEISAPDVVYFDPFLERRLDGWEALRKLYEPWRGEQKIESSYELINPLVQVSGNMAVLTFNYVDTTAKKIHRWNCTEVYRQDEGQWKIIQTHWSWTQPLLKSSAD